MAAIRGRDTKPELMLRRGLHREGFRYRLHVNDMPGKPDMVFPKHHAVIFVNGCFWHGHDCLLFRWPSSQQEFWSAKITKNRARDARVKEILIANGWRVLTVWECALKGAHKRAAKSVIAQCEGWLLSRRRSTEIRGRQ